MNDQEVKEDLRNLCKTLDINFDKVYRRAQQYFADLNPMNRDLCALNFMVGYIGHAIEIRDGKPMKIKKPKEKSLAEKVSAGVIAVTSKPSQFFIPQDTLEALCDCAKCEDGIKISEFCALYRKKLVEKFPVTPFTLSNGKEVYRVGDVAVIPKETLDEYVNATVDRLRELRKPIDEFYRERLMWRVDELEDIRRQLHIAVLVAAGCEPFDCGYDAMALKVVIEDYVEKRAQLFGGF